MATPIPSSPLYSEDPHRKLIQVALALDNSGLVPAQPSSVDTRKAFADLVKPGLDMTKEADRDEARSILLGFIRDHLKRGTWNTTKDHSAFSAFFRNKAAFSDSFNMIIKEALTVMRQSPSSLESTPSTLEVTEPPVPPHGSRDTMPSTSASALQPSSQSDELLGLSERMELYRSESPKEAIRNAEDALKLVLDVSAMSPDSLFESVAAREAVRQAAATTKDLAPLHPEIVRLTAAQGSAMELDRLCQTLVSVYPKDEFKNALLNFIFHAPPSHWKYLIYELSNSSTDMQAFVATDLTMLLKGSTKSEDPINDRVQDFIRVISDPNHRGEISFVISNLHNMSPSESNPQATIDDILIARMIKNLLQSDIDPMDLLRIGQSLLENEKLDKFFNITLVSIDNFRGSILERYIPNPRIEAIYRELAKFGTFQMLRLFTPHPSHKMSSLPSPREMVIDHFRARFFKLIGPDVRVIDDSVIVRGEIPLLTSLIRKCYCLEKLRLNIGRDAYFGSATGHETLGTDFYSAFRSNPRLNTLRSLTLVDCQRRSFDFSGGLESSIPKSELGSFSTFMKCPQLSQLTHLTLENISSDSFNLVANSDLRQLTHLNCDLNDREITDFHSNKGYYNDCAKPLEQLLHGSIGDSLEVFDITLHSNFDPDNWRGSDEDYLRMSKLSLLDQIIRNPSPKMRQLRLRYFGFLNCLKMIDEMIETSPYCYRFHSKTTRHTEGVITLPLYTSFQGNIVLTIPKIEGARAGIIDLSISESQNIKDGRQLEAYLLEEMRKRGTDLSHFKLFLGKRELSSFNYVELLNEIPKSTLIHNALSIVPHAIKDLDIDHEGHYYLHQSGPAAWVERLRKGRHGAAGPAAPPPS